MSDLQVTILVVLSLLLIVTIVVGCFALRVRNDLSQRWTRLLALAANVRVARQRRQGVAQDISRHLHHAQRHEQRVTQSGAKRGGRGGRLIKVADNGNGWPSAATTNVSAEAMRMDKQSRDDEMAARTELHADAEKLQLYPSDLAALLRGESVRIPCLAVQTARSETQ